MDRSTRLLCALLCALAATPSVALVTAAPPVVSVVLGREAAVEVRWVFEREPFERVQSAQGVFITPFDLAPLQVVRVPLEARLARGAGAVVEKLAVPPALLEAMRARGLTQVSYVRLFGESEGTVAVQLGGAPSAKVTVDRIELAFPAGGPEPTVPLRGAVPAAVATVRYQGAGVLEAAWEVDGKVHARVSQVVGVLGSARFEAPELPPLPTAVPGAHQLRFVPARGARGLDVPALAYRVTADAPEAAPSPLALTAPAPEAALPFEEVWLTWARGGGALFFVDLRECDSGAALFSAYTRETAYRLPAFGVSPWLVPGRVLCWRVTGFDDTGQLVEASEVRRLRLLHARGAP